MYDTFAFWVGTLIVGAFGLSAALILTVCILQYFVLGFLLYRAVLKSDVFKPAYKRHSLHKVRFFFYCLFNKEFFVTSYMFKDIVTSFPNARITVNSLKIIPTVDIVKTREYES